MIEMYYSVLKEIREWKFGRWEESNLLAAISKSLLLSRTRKMAACLIQLDCLPGYGLIRYCDTMTIL